MKKGHKRPELVVLDDNPALPFVTQASQSVRLWAMKLTPLILGVKQDSKDVGFISSNPFQA